MRSALLSILLCASLQAGTVASPTLVEQGYQQMYNLDFDGAHRSFADFQRERPEDPLGPVSDAAAYLFNEFDRLHILQSQFFVDDNAFRGMKKPLPDPSLKQKFEEDLAKSQKLSDAVLHGSQEPRSIPEKNAMFASVLRMGLRSDYLS